MYVVLKGHTEIQKFPFFINRNIDSLHAKDSRLLNYVIQGVIQLTGKEFQFCSSAFLPIALTNLVLRILVQ